MNKKGTYIDGKGLRTGKDLRCCCLINLCRIYKDLSQIKDALLPHTPEGDEERKEIPESDSEFVGLALFVHNLLLGITEKT